VITLLKDMLKQLEKEAEKDEQIYHKLACWCETKDREKTKAMADDEAPIAALTTEIKEKIANGVRLDTEIKNTEKEAMSYVVGAEAMKKGEFKGEDTGVAINGGMGVNKVAFDSRQIESYGAVSHAMGEYAYTDATSSDNVRVEYIVAYKRCKDGQERICLRHSSVPYAPAVLPPVTP